MEINVKLTARTPLWSGNVDGNCGWPDESAGIRETSIIGSIRWWTEAILRSLDGFFICDPVNKAEKNNLKCCPVQIKSKAHICPSCLLFGATGLRKGFRLEISGGEPGHKHKLCKIKPGGRQNGWNLGPGMAGNFDLKIVPLDKDFDPVLLLFPLRIASNWAAIGAKSQHGYGVIDFSENIDCITLEKYQAALTKYCQARLKKSNMYERTYIDQSQLPSIRDFFFARVRFRAQGDWWKKIDGIKNDSGTYPKVREWFKSGIVPVSPAIKNWLRYKEGKKLWQQNGFNNKTIEQFLLGSAKGEKSASRINISFAYKTGDDCWEYRVWGWIPQDYPGGHDNRRIFLNSLKEALKGGNKSINLPVKQLLGIDQKEHWLLEWREFELEKKDCRLEDYINSLAVDGGEVNE